MVHWTGDRILNAAQAMGVNPNSSGVVGIYVEVDLGTNNTVVGGGGEGILFIGVDLRTGDKMLAMYTGGQLGVGVSPIPFTSFGGGAFAFSGSIEQMAGPSIGMQLSSGVTAGLHASINGEVLATFGANISAGVNVGIGQTWAVRIPTRSGYIDNRGFNSSEYGGSSYVTPFEGGRHLYTGSQTGTLSPFGMYGQYMSGAYNLSSEAQASLVDVFDQLYANVPVDQRHTVSAYVNADNRLVLTYHDGVIGSATRSAILEPVFGNLFGDYRVQAVQLPSGLLQHNISIDGVRVESIRYQVEADGSLKAVRSEIVIGEGTDVITKLRVDPDTGLAIPSHPQIRIDQDHFDNIQQMNEIYGQVGRVIGSTIGGLLSDELGLDGVAGVVADTAFSAVFGQIGAAFGAALDEGGDFLDAFGGNLETAFTHTLAPALGNAAVGTVSSLLTAEMADVIGLNGAAADVFGLVGGSVMNALGNQLVSNLFNPGLSSLFDGAGGAIADSLGSFGNFSADLGVSNPLGAFLGAKLGSLVVSPTTQAGAVLSSLGSSVGSLVAGKILGSAITKIFGNFANLIVPGIGAFVGFVLGALIGNLFGRKEPPTPLADADTVLNFDNGYYELGG